MNKYIDLSNIKEMDFYCTNNNLNDKIYIAQIG
jgi:hypothetical protein